MRVCFQLKYAAYVWCVRVEFIIWVLAMSCQGNIPERNGVAFIPVKWPLGVNG